jgi:hypothetical protein
VETGRVVAATAAPWNASAMDRGALPNAVRLEMALTRSYVFRALLPRFAVMASAIVTFAALGLVASDFGWLGTSDLVSFGLVPVVVFAVAVLLVVVRAVKFNPQTVTYLFTPDEIEVRARDGVFRGQWRAIIFAKEHRDRFVLRVRQGEYWLPKDRFEPGGVERLRALIGANVKLPARPRRPGAVAIALWIVLMLMFVAVYKYFVQAPQRSPKARPAPSAAKALWDPSG